jgi:hypothetical protein
MFTKELRPGQYAEFRFEIENGIGKLFLPETLEPIIVLLNTHPVDLKVSV